MEIKIDNLTGEITINKNYLGDITVILPPQGTCITCENFDWWDGDWCCLENFLILGTSSSLGEFREDIFNSIPVIRTRV